MATKQINKMKGYKNVSIPIELIKKIDEKVLFSKMGFKSRSEYIKEAIREKLKEENNGDANDRF